MANGVFQMINDLLFLLTLLSALGCGLHSFSDRPTGTGSAEQTRRHGGGGGAASRATRAELLDAARDAFTQSF